MFVGYRAMLAEHRLKAAMSSGCVFARVMGSLRMRRLSMVCGKAIAAADLPKGRSEDNVLVSLIMGHDMLMS